MNTNQQLSMTRTGQPDEEAIRLIRGYEAFALSLDPRGYCVCTSEGKDSRVLGHLMRRAGVKHFYLHNITGIDPPELVYFQRRNFQEYKDAGYLTYDLMYRKSMWQLMENKLCPPLRKMRYCCEEFKERHTEEQGAAMIVTGVRRAESVKRKKSRSELEFGRTHLNPYDQDGEIDMETMQVCYDNPEWREKGGLFKLNPIAEWPDNWLWDYINEARLDQCVLYQEGFARLGCIGCPMSTVCHRLREFERWPKFRDMYINTFDRMIEARERLGKRQDYANGQEWFEWWINEPEKLEDDTLDGAVSMFDEEATP